jgi:preprotein translocase subunit YajC
MTSIPDLLPALLLMVPREGGNTGVIFIVQIVIMVAIFWFLLIRPQQKEQKRHQEMLSAIKRGDEIVTSGGLVGRVDKVQEDRLTVTTGDKTKVTVQRSRVATVLGRDGEPKDGSA